MTAVICWPAVTGPIDVQPTCRATATSGELVVDPVVCLITDRGTALEQRWSLSLEDAVILADDIRAATFQAPQVAALMAREIRARQPQGDPHAAPGR